MKIMTDFSHDPVFSAYEQNNLPYRRRGGLRKTALLAAAVTNCFLHHYLLNQTGNY